MNRLYPLKFKPIYKDKIWGGEKMRTLFGMDFSPLPNCGEAWLLSGVKDNQSVVENGFLAGNELNELVEVYMEDLVGDDVFEKHGNVFPILVKLIDSKDWLSIQVHPDDDLARKRKIGSGKTEMWYVINAEENAQLISGFSKKIDKETYLNHLENKSLKEILNFENVKSGDVFFIPSGRVHALGPGVFLAEIQQTSDITYRIYDWDRIQPDGTLRKLHTDEALDAIDFKIYDDYRTYYKKKKNETAELVSCNYFTTNLIDLDKALAKDYSQLSSFVLYLCIEGSVDIDYGYGKIQCKKGDVILIPAEIKQVKILPKPHTKLLEVFII